MQIRDCGIRIGEIVQALTFMGSKIIARDGFTRDANIAPSIVVIEPIVQAGNWWPQLYFARRIPYPKTLRKRVGMRTFATLLL
jgi:hypothetical protein